MRVKIKFTQKELKQRAAKHLKLDVKNILSANPTMGGVKFFVLTDEYAGGIGNCWQNKYFYTITIWEIVEALPIENPQLIADLDIFSLSGLFLEQLKLLELKTFPRTIADLKKAYRKMSKIFHPDQGGTAEQFNKLNKAYQDILKYQNNLFKPQSQD